MIEQVARAIAHAVSLQSDSGVYPKWSDFRDEARAAIRAMREPTEQVLSAGEETMDEYSPGTPVDLIWKSMIDRALIE